MEQPVFIIPSKDIMRAFEESTVFFIPFWCSKDQLVNIPDVYSFIPDDIIKKMTSSAIRPEELKLLAHTTFSSQNNQYTFIKVSREVKLADYYSLAFLLMRYRRPHTMVLSLRYGLDVTPKFAVNTLFECKPAGLVSDLQVLVSELEVNSVSWYITGRKNCVIQMW